MNNVPLRFVASGKNIQKIASEFGWRPGARYTNLRDVREIRFATRGFLDIHWARYDFKRHLAAAILKKPFITVARDVINIKLLDQVLDEALELQKYATHVVIVPKDPRLGNKLCRAIPKKFLLGYSCPSKYGSTLIPPEKFARPVHLLGGRPDVQRRLGEIMPVYSFDCNRFTIDAKYGDYFDGKKFRPLGYHNYEHCLRLSFAGINEMWKGYPRCKL